MRAHYVSLLPGRGLQRQPREGPEEGWRGQWLSKCHYDRVNPRDGEEDSREGFFAEPRGCRCLDVRERGALIGPQTEGDWKGKGTTLRSLRASRRMNWRGVSGSREGSSQGNVTIDHPVGKPSFAAPLPVVLQTRVHIHTHTGLG